MKSKSPYSSGTLRNSSSSKPASFFLVLMFLFALNSPVSAALPSNELWREELTKNIIGFGKNTTGGKGGTLCQVTNLNDSGAGSLRACAEAVGPMWITFSVSGTITLLNVIHMKSNKTIDGRGANIVIANRGITIGTWTTQLTGPVSNVIIHNITMRNIKNNGMIIIAENASNVWIDHCTFQNAIDEILYIGSGSNLTSTHIAPHSITVSWNHFPTTTPGQGWADKSLLVSDPGNIGDVNTTITIHHNHYQTYIRHPLARYAKIHAFNNYYEATGRSLDLYTDVKFYSQNEIFKLISGAANPTIKLAGNEPWDPRGAASVKVLNPMLLNGAQVVEVNASSIFSPTSFYSYTADTANTALQAAIVNGAGRKDVIPPTSSSVPSPPTDLFLR